MNLDRHHIVERYINGEMSPAEERELLRLASVDPELDTLIRAERLVRTTMVGERNALPTDHAQTYARFLGALAASVPATSDAEEAIPMAKVAGSSRRRGLLICTAATIFAVGLLAIFHTADAPPTTGAFDTARYLYPLPSLADIEPSTAENPTAAAAPEIVDDRPETSRRPLVARRAPVTLERDMYLQPEIRTSTSPAEETPHDRDGISIFEKGAERMTTDTLIVPVTLDVDERPVFVNDTVRTRIEFEDRAPR